MGKRKNGMLSTVGEEIVDNFYNNGKFSNENIFTKKQYGEILLKGIKVTAKNEKQKKFLSTIDNNEITICIGESGVGKSYLSIAKALDLLKDSTKGYEKIFLITPIVENEGESIGYLKGSLEDKTGPYLYSLYYLIDKIIGDNIRKKLVENKIIEPLCISFMRGMNLDNCIVVLDEGQNVTIPGMKTVLTRIGFNTKYIISGDLRQIDRFKKPNDSGLQYAFEKLKNVNNIGIVEFDRNDIVRNPIINDILDRFE